MKRKFEEQTINLYAKSMLQNLFILIPITCQCVSETHFSSICLQAVINININKIFSVIKTIILKSS